MPKNAVKVSAPGSLMLTGEHAVLRGYPALVAAVDLRMHVMIEEINQPEIFIESDKFGQLQLLLNEEIESALESIQPPFHFIKNILLQFSQSLKSLALKPKGIKMTIQSDFSPTLGLGSSAALTVAALYALSLWFEENSNLDTLALCAREIIRKSQNGLGSGADVMASVFGGVVYYVMEPFMVEPLAHLPPLITVYSGSKTPTPIVIDIVNNQEKKEPAKFNTIFKQMGDHSHVARQAILSQDWPQLGRLFSEHALLQDAIGVSSPLLNEIQNQLKKQPQIYGAKISGSGLGDCVIAVGELPANCEIQTVKVHLSNQGVRCEAK